MVLAPGWYPDYSSIARFCNEKGAFELALRAAHAGLERDPRHPLLHLRLAQSYDGLGDFERAVATCEATHAFDPAPDVAAQLDAACALALESLGRIDEAVARVTRGIATSPECIEPHVAYAGILGRSGAFPDAWRELEFFFLDERGWFRQRFGVPEWDGEAIRDRHLLVVHGQGAGDLLQMARYVPQLRERAASVTIEVTGALQPMLASLDGVTLVAKDTVPRANVDVFCRAMALPRILGETGAEPPRGYLAPPSDRVEHWRRRLGDRGARRRIGLAWAGNPYHGSDHLRSLTLQALAPFARLDEIEWISLQVGPRAFDAAPARLDLRRFHGDVRDFADTAAIVAACDLVISVDTAVAHLAGAIGAPVWLLLPARPEWRWPRSGARSPWYASMRLFHAARDGWPAAIDGALAAVRADGATSA